jgi:hypothetical protein
MSVLELLDTITGAYNNWVDGIKNDDPTFIGQIKGDLHLFSVYYGDSAFNSAIELAPVRGFQARPASARAWLV